MNSINIGECEEENGLTDNKVIGYSNNNMIKTRNSSKNNSGEKDVYLNNENNNNGRLDEESDYSKNHDEDELDIDDDDDDEDDDEDEDDDDNEEDDDEYVNTENSKIEEIGSYDEIQENSTSNKEDPDNAYLRKLP